eukprot:CAMPEP_0113631816 /NCGR_PEP_ID=MMETSP0017_2-20120614/16532_1 /TAXON_ID=2856 /ORGANISM="Cylindrotheca closterium" /LENGTH=181 /DNA_ID=CAMNT_0000542337 /DNA_START=35 /DNA_END=580 /DNA_ORIENTATION=- /assembly_acc=CAM_ASM_000147
MTSKRLSILSILAVSSLLASVVVGLSTTPNQGASRRAFLDTAAKVVPVIALSAPAFADEEAAPAAPAPEPTPEPEPTPAPSTDENEFIARLKKQSEANKDKYTQQAIRSDKLSNGQFSSQYQRPSYVGVRRTNGAYEMVTPSELDGLLKSGKVELTYDAVIVDKQTGEAKKDLSKKVYAYK